MSAERRPLQHVWPETSGALAGDAYGDGPQNLALAIKEVVGRFPDRVAAIEGATHLTYAELWTAAERSAHQLRAGGVRAGDVVALLFDNRVTFLVWLIGAILLGAVPALLNARLTRDELQPLIDLVSPRTLVAGPDQWDRAATLALSEAVLLPDLIPDSKAPTEGPWPGLLADADEGVLLLFTSGTTAGSKAALLTHRNLLHSGESYRRIFGLGERDVTLIAVPLFHVTGLIGQWLPVLLAGGTSVLLARFDADEAARLLHEHGVSFVFFVPTVLIRLLRLWEAGYDLPASLRVAASGGAPLPEVVMETVSTRLSGLRFFNTYGMTEVASPATILPAADFRTRPGSAGLAAPGVSLRIVDPGSLEDVPAGSSGELLIAGPNVMSGYWRNPAATHHAMVERERRYIRSGDLARQDDAGYIYILDRLKDLINRGGEKIYGGEVEQALYRHPEILEVSVVGLPDPEWGEVVGAAIVFRERALDRETLRRWLKERLAAYKVPTRWATLAELPRNANGKVDRRRVRELFS